MFIQNTWNYRQAPATSSKVRRPNRVEAYKPMNAVFELDNQGFIWKFIPAHLNVYSPNSGKAFHFETIEELREFYAERLLEGFVIK